jgi:ATP/maltotriose-dependent transcriptional regulator MalT
MLKTQLSPTDIAALYSRASEWCSKHHLLEEALQYALAAGEVENAVHLVESHRYELMNTEQWHRLERWLEMLPADAVTQNPLLNCAKAFIAVSTGQDQDIISSISRVEQLLPELTPESVEHEIVQSELAVIHAILDIMAGNPTQSIHRVESSLKFLPRQALHIRSIAIAALGVALQMQGDLMQGVTVLRDALVEDSWPDRIQARLMHYLGVTFYQEGDLINVIISARTGLWISEKHELTETLSWCRHNM